MHTSEVGFTRFHPCHCNLIITPDETMLPASKRECWVKPACPGASPQMRRLLLSCGQLTRVPALSQGSKHRGDAILGMPIAPTQPSLPALHIGAGRCICINCPTLRSIPLGWRRHKSVLLTALGQEPSQGSVTSIGALPSPTGSIPLTWLQLLGGCPITRMKMAPGTARRRTFCCAKCNDCSNCMTNMSSGSQKR